MTTMQEALADKYLAAAEIPEFLQQTADLMQRSFANEKYGNEGLALTNGESASDTDGSRAGIPTRAQNRIRSGRSGRRAANTQQVLAAVGGLTYKGPWDALKASSKPADYKLCRVEADVKQRVAGTRKQTPRETKPTPVAKAPKGNPTAKKPERSSLLAAVTMQFSHLNPNNSTTK